MVRCAQRCGYHTLPPKNLEPCFPHADLRSLALPSLTPRGEVGVPSTRQRMSALTLVESLSLHSVYDTTKCTRDGDMLTAGGAVGGAPFEPCRRRSHAPALSHASPPWQSRVKHALSYRNHGAVPGKRPVAWATANQYRISVTITSYSPVREPGAGRGSACAVGRCVWCIRGPGDIPPRHA